MKGYKVFNSDWTCRDFQYEVGKTYKMDKEPVPCECGFHFCKKAVDCFHYYEFNPSNKVAEIEAVGEIRSNGDKSCTNEIRILREIPWCEVLELVNVGENCTGIGNIGNNNTGNYNIAGRNTGDFNTGCYNTDDRNTGHCNSGYRNSGSYNSGNYNSGDRNSGSCNSGNRNSGHRNTGDWNCTDYSTGCFNTEMDKIRLFNKISNWTLEDWRKSKAYLIMRECPSGINNWKSWESMNNEEREKYPEAEITDGYLAKEEVDVQKWWNWLSESDKNIVMDLPNFDADIFKKCTGIEVGKR